MYRKLICLALILLSTAACAEEVSYDPIQFTFWADPAAGYEWSYAYEDNGVLGEPFVEEVEAEGGAGVNYQYSFGVNAPGEARIVFNYGANYSVLAPEKTVLCSVVAHEDGSRDVRWVESYSGDNTLVVMLPSNPTTGWTWQYAGEESGMLTLLSEDYQPTNVYLEGAGGTTTYQFRVESPGATAMVFNYADMWDPEAASEETYSVIVVVSEDMEISLSVGEE